MKCFAIASPRTPVFAGIAAVLVTLGCAAGPRPKALDDANSMLTHQDVAELEGITPKLVAESKDLLRKANEAYEDGDGEQAELYARLAAARLETARNHVAARSARKLAKLMAARGTGLDDEADRARARQAELKRFGLLESRIEALHVELSRKPEGDAPEVTAAKRALAKARRKQAEAIGAGAAGLPDYQQGASLVSGAIESLEMGIYGESKLSSVRALAAFDRAIEAARAPKPDNSAADAAARQRAEDALSEASSAQTLAIAAGAAHESPALYQRAAALYGSAERRFDRDDYPGTLRLAREAKQAFVDASARLSATAPGPAVPLSPTGSPYGKSTEALIIELRMKRAELLGAGKDQSCSASFKELEALIELAQDRLRVGDERSAREFAVRAEERVKRCDTPALVAATVGPSETDIAAGIAKRRATEALRNAQGELARAQARLPGDKRLGQPKTLVTNAERWLDRGDYAQAERMADKARLALAVILAAPLAADEPLPPAGDPARDQAAALLVRAQSMHAELVTRLGEDARLREPERQLREAERWFDRESYAQAKQLAERVIAKLTKLGATPPKADEPTKQLSSEGQRAAAALEAARDAKVRAVLALVRDEDLRMTDRLLERGQSAFEERRYGTARMYAEKARQQYLRLIESKTGAKPSEPAVSSCGKARDRLDTADGLARRTKGKHLSRSEQRLHQRGSSLATVGRLRLRDQQCAEALTLADDAVDALQSLPRAPSDKAAKKPTKKKPTKKKPTKLGPGGEKIAGDAEAPWQSAYQKTMAALRARDAARKAVTPATRPTFDRGIERLADSRAAYKAKRYPEASASADGALAMFEAVLAAAGRRLPAPVASPRQGSQPAAATPEPISGRGKTTVTTGAPRADASWKGPYRAVFAALAQRDKAAAAAKTDDEKATLERGKDMLERAQRAWQQKSFTAAGELAKLAKAEFDAVLAGSHDDPADPAVAMRKADAALREARVVLQVCERDKCAERDFAELTRGKEMLKSAEQSYESEDYPYATELAKKAKAKLSLILTKRRPEAPKVEIDPELERRAKEAIGEAGIAQQMCESRDCAKLNLEGWLRAQQSLASAKSALADGQLDRAVRLAESAREAYGAIQPASPTAPSFTIPAGVTAVTRSGSQLYLNPPIDFPSGTSRLQPAGRATVAELAKVLLANRDVLAGVRVLGFTDSSGNAVVNKNLSGRRADAVREGLVQAGVPAALLSSEGRGSDSPIADNGTPEGRKANRRVEIHFDTQ